MYTANTAHWTSQASLYLIFLGLSSHLYFVRGEWDNAIWKQILALFLLQPLSLVVLVASGCGVLGSFMTTLILDLSYLLPLFLSIALYRLFFHRLHKFPGPFWARLSMLWMVKKLNNQDQYELLHALHQKYGDVVRIGPRRISINRASAISAIYGAGSKCRKAVFYDVISSDFTSLQNERDPKSHHARRPAWDKALSARTNMEYEPRLMRLTNILVSKFAEYENSSIEIHQWFRCFVFDMMGELGFSKTYGCLDNGTLHPAIQKIVDLLWVNTIVGQVPWVASTMFKLPFLPNPLDDFKNFSRKCLEERKMETTYIPDAMSYVFEGKVKLTKEELVEDTMLLQIAGSDTTLSALVNLLYHLAVDKNIQRELRSEIDNAVPADQPLQFSHIGNLPFLESVINETLRLHPPVPSGLPRETPQEGIWVDDFHIPGGIIVSNPTWSIHHDPRNFPSPELFLPHRWTPSSTLPPHDRQAFIPFSVGPYNCAGRLFAMMEMKTVIARVVQTFEIELAPGEDGSTLFTQSYDHLTLDVGPLMLSFKRRNIS